MADRIAEDFEEFDRNHPQVYVLFDKYTRSMLDKRGKASAKRIWERLRWEAEMVFPEKTIPKLNNNYTALYAREWMRRNPDQPKAFNLRKRRAHTVNSTEFDEEDTI